MSILVYDRDPTVVDFLRRETAPLGYGFSHARTASAIKDFAGRQQIVLAFLELDDPENDVAALATSLHTMQPEAQVFMMGRRRDADELLPLLRRSGHDYLVKPIQAQEFHEAVATRVRRRDRLMAVRTQLEEEVAELKAIAGGNPTLREDLREELSTFLELSLQTFMQLERQNVELRQRVAVVDDPASAARMNRIFHAWITHSDPRFSQGVLALEDRIGIKFDKQMTTGGEVLDRISAEKPDLVLLGDSLPDIPAELITESIRSEHPSVAIVMVRRWGAPDMYAELLGQKEGDSLVRPLRNADDLVAVLESAKARCAAADLGREFFRKFSESHGKFLDHYRTFRRLLEGLQG